jgi:MYXO-CTERM domain-containing protein
VCLVAALCSIPAVAVPFNLEFAWNAVAGLNGNSADGFRFRFTEPSGQLRVTQLSVTLGAATIYDLTNTGPGYLTWGPYSVNDGGAGSTLTSAPIGEGLAGNRTLSWDFSSFTHGGIFGFQADVDESGACGGGIAGAICQVNVDTILPSGFVSRGGIDVGFTVAYSNGSGSATFHAPSAGQNWDTHGLTASTVYSGDVNTPEPATWVLGAAGLALCALRRRRAS